MISTIAKADADDIALPDALITKMAGDSAHMIIQLPVGYRALALDNGGMTAAPARIFLQGEGHILIA